MTVLTYDGYITEAKTKPVVFTFGRFNPVTAGHEIMIKDVIKQAKSRGGQPMIFTSQTQDNKKNPLSYKDKIKFLKMFWGKIIIKDSKIQTAFHALEWLSKKGYKNVTLVVGSDRVERFEKNVRPYVKSYGFDHFEVVQAGIKRGAGNEMSASKMRKFAADGDFESYKKGMPSGASEQDAQKVYDAVRKGLGIREQYLEFGTNLTTKKYKEWTPGQPISDDKVDEEITSIDLKQVESFADKIFAKVGIDVEFTRHFLERANDKRNGKEINVAELIRLFKETYKKHGKNIPKLGANAQAVLNDTQTDLNLPFVLKWDQKAEEFDLVSKTIMRKKDFKTSNIKLKV